MFWYLIFCSAAVYLGFAILVGRIFASDGRAYAQAYPAARGRAEDDAPPGRDRIEDELQAQSWSEALHTLFLPETL